MRISVLTLALTLLAAPAAVATEAPAPTPPATEVPALAAKEVDTTPARAKAQEVRTQAVEVKTAKQEIGGYNLFWLIGVVVVIVAVVALLN